MVELLASRRELLLFLATYLNLKLQLHLYLVDENLLVLILAESHVATRRCLHSFLLLLLLEQKLHLLNLLDLLNLLQF